MATDAIPFLKYLTNEGVSIEPIEHIRLSQGAMKITCLLSSPYAGAPTQTYYIERIDASSAKVVGNKALDCNTSRAEKIANDNRIDIMSTPTGRFFGIHSSEEGVLAALMCVYRSENAFFKRKNGCS